LRTIGDPRRRFAEDPLRILRGVRFEADLGLAPDAATSAAMAEFAPRVGGLVAGRQYDELRGIVAATDWRRGIMRLLDLGALDGLLPELAGESSELRTRLSSVAAEDDVPARWIALFGNAARAVAALTRLTAPRSDRRAISIRS
jgi:tRNA nucleotidyltransferase/poly(A) polymerase